jgi:hypothetical protein
MMKIFKALEQLNYPEPAIDNNVRSSYFKMTFKLAGVNTNVADHTPTKRLSDQVAAKRPSKDFELNKLAILRICLIPQKLKDIMNATGHKHRHTFMTNYITPLVKEELLNLTLPDTPRDPRQMYQTTEKGRMVLQ